MNTSTLNLTIQLPKFEGPLALLLYLIRKEEMNIFDIEIHKITAQYLEYIRLMKEFDLELAGEFIAMASTLIQIKSRMLLPTYNEQGEIVETEDPRKELVQRLLEYEKFQEAGKQLYARPLLGRDMWARGVREKFEEGPEEIELEDNALFSLITAYRKALKSAQKRYHKVAAKAQSIASRIMEIKDRLILGQRIAMSELITSVDQKRRQVLITFLSALELAKMGFVRLFQTEVGAEIYMETVQQIDAASISRVEEYESLIKPEEEVAAANATVVPISEDELNGLDGESAAANPSAQMTLDENFELKDMDFVEEGEAELAPDEIATDEEIEAAEAELLATEAGAETVESKTEEEVPQDLASNESEQVSEGEIDGQI